MEGERLGLERLEAAIGQRAEAVCASQSAALDKAVKALQVRVGRLGGWGTRKSRR